MKDGQNGDGSFSFSDHIFQNGAVARGQWFSATMTHFYEHPKDDPSIPEIWCYTDKLSYEPGEEVVF